MVFPIFIQRKFNIIQDRVSILTDKTDVAYRTDITI
jgi:hypothetical protein